MKKILAIGILGLSLLLGVNSVKAQCPSIWAYGNQHIETEYYDTVVTCENPSIQLQCHYFFTASTYNGSYVLESIPYNPPEPFNAGTAIPVSSDDTWDELGGLDIDFPFQFFGVTQDHVTVCGNGVVTFNDVVAGSHTGYSWNEHYPINPGPGRPTTFPHKNSILACASDMDPAYIPHGEQGTNGGTRGIFKYNGGTYPCRHITFSWNQVPVFGHSSQQNTYNCTHQVVFYEGTNIVELHIKKHRSLGTAGNQKTGIGILNSTGTQAYMAPGRNPFDTPIDSNNAEAWRWTPQGPTRVNLSWFKYSDDMQDSTKIVSLTANINNGVNDPDAYLVDQPGASNNDTVCVVTPTKPTVYRCWAKYIDVVGNLIVLSANYRVGIDTANYTDLTSTTERICHGSDAIINLVYPNTGDTAQHLRNAVWNSFRLVNGQRVPVTESRCHYNADNSQLVISPLPDDEVIENHIDTTIVYVQATYENGCTNNDSIIIQTFPNFAFHREEGICLGETFEFCGNQYQNTCVDSVMLQSTAGCDSLEILHLTVFDVSHTVDHQKACNEYTWPNNNETYTTSTNAPIVTLENRYGCDSVVNLDLEIIPVTAAISASPTNATLDELNIRLTDVSVGNDTREWLLPDGSTRASTSFTYPYPPEYDSVKVGLAAISNLGCSDTAYINISLLRESMWVPNAFNPTAEAPNNVFAPKGIGITYLNVLIFDRSGRRVAVIDGINDSWDGTTEDGQICPQGAYVYTMRYRTVLAPESTKTKTGTITLIR